MKQQGQERFYCYMCGDELTYLNCEAAKQGYDWLDCFYYGSFERVACDTCARRIEAKRPKKDDRSWENLHFDDKVKTIVIIVALLGAFLWILIKIGSCSSKESRPHWGSPTGQIQQPQPTSFLDD